MNWVHPSERHKKCRFSRCSWCCNTASNDTSEEEMKEEAPLIYTCKQEFKLHVFASTNLCVQQLTGLDFACSGAIKKTMEKVGVKREDNLILNYFIFLTSRPTCATEVSQQLLSSSWASRGMITVTNPEFPRTWKASCFDVADNHRIKISTTNEITHLLA